MGSTSSAKHLTIALVTVLVDGILASPPLEQSFGVRGLAAFFVLWAGSRWAPFAPERGDEWPSWGRPRASLRLAARTAAVIAALGLIALALLWLVVRLGGWTWSHGPRPADGEGAFSGHLFTAVVAAPIVEELVYRGVLYPRLRAAWGAVQAIVVSGIAFWVVHWAARGAISSPHHLAAGWLLAWARERSRSLLAPTILHAAGNFAFAIADLCRN